MTIMTAMTMTTKTMTDAQREKSMKRNPTFSKRLKEARTKIGYTQRELSEKSQVSCSVVESVEGGIADATTKNLLKLARALEVPAGWLAGDDA